VEDIAVVKGYLSYPKYHGVELVLQAIVLINMVKEQMDKQRRKK